MGCFETMSPSWVGCTQNGPWAKPASSKKGSLVYSGYQIRTENKFKHI
jgi:hypothetical protein